MDKAMKVTSKVYKQSKDAEQESKEYSIPNSLFTSLSEKVGICIVCIDLGSTSFLQSSPGLAS
jgi:hypothetical protein